VLKESEMPYELRKFGKGMKVVSPNHPSGFSKKPMTKRMAYEQLKAIYAQTGGK
jgi:hypothetical protein